MVFLDCQFPELVLQNDGHFIRKTLAQMRGDLHSRCACFEGDIEVVVARKRRTCRLNLAEHPAHNRAQSLLHDLVIRDKAVWCIGHCGFQVARGWPRVKGQSAD